MKKVLIAMAFAFTASLSMLAQSSIFNNPANKAYFGIRVAGEVTCPGEVSEDGTGISVFKNGGGVEFGGIFNAPVVANFYIEPGLKFYYNTYSMKGDFVGAIDNSSLIKSVITKKFGMRIPVMAGYHFDFTDDIKVSVFTGPELEIGFSAKEKVSSRTIDVSNDLYGDDAALNRVDLLWGMGAGITYQHVYFGVSGSLGMLNMLHDSDFTFHENRVSFTLGYNF
ncbi:MAG: PorT family protein [Bacteroidales bacterium]|nr:PorT family protein [Bacteroidales bacterium]MBD5234909.1 PorT family protein [Barnesiella sp.]MBD5248396.1 PorT family protein [Barnesiella sp.]